MTREELLSDIEKLHYELSTETRLVRVGLKEEQNLKAILQKFPRLAEKSTLVEAKAWLDAARDNDERERLSRIYFHCLGRTLHKELVPLDDEIHTFLAQAKVSVNREEISYYQIYPLIIKEASFEKRELLGEAMQEIHEKGNPLLREILEKELELLTSEFSFPGYAEYCSQKKGLDYETLAEIFKSSAKRTRSLYEKEMGAQVERILGRRLGEVKRFHIFQLSNTARFDHFFAKETLLKRMEASLSGAGILLSSFPNIHLDLEERPRKNPRACVFTPRVPQEIHLIVKPVGGLKDDETFLHEAGHALHYGSTDRKLPYEYRELSRSYALSETYAFLLQNLTMSIPWLMEVAGMSEEEASEVRRVHLLNDLFMFRRYIAKFLTELEFFKEKDLDNRSIYAANLLAHTRFIYEGSNYLFDMDAEFYSVDYLRAWIAEAQLADYVAKQWGSRWYSKKEAGDFLKDLWKRGESLDPELLVKDLGYSPFDPSLLESRFAELQKVPGQVPGT